MNSIERIFTTQQAQAAHAPSVLVKERIALLQRLKKAIIARSAELREAVFADYGKDPAEVDLTEIFTSLTELDLAISSIKTWTRPKRVRTPIALFGTQSKIRFEAKGVVLIIGPWNYPFSLLIIPLVSALSAGNRVILKPSELTPKTSAFIARLITEVFNEDMVAVIEGGAEVSQQLTALPFDHIFFTGSSRVGRFIAQAAAKNLTPVTLELGGKSPVIVDASANLRSAAERIVWGKFVNSGQTCVAPDYVMAPRDKISALCAELKNEIHRRYGSGADAAVPSRLPCRIINTAQHQRVKDLVERSIAAGAVLETGGVANDVERCFAPTLLSAVPHDAPIMREEIFGPVLPVLSYESLDEVYRFIRTHGKPLALYIFSEDSRQSDAIIENTRAGGTCINNTLIHLLNPHLPFGGVGESGSGSYHGYCGFRTFSHERAVMSQRFGNLLKLMYPPYTGRVRKTIGLAIRFLS